MTPHLERFRTYEEACREFRWLIPDRFNLASAICRRHRDAITRIALSESRPGGINTYTFGGLDFLSDKFATTLFRSGLAPGDRVAVALPASAALAVAQLGALKAGGEVVPLSLELEPFKLTLSESGARFLIIDESLSGVVDSAGSALGRLTQVYVARDLRSGDALRNWKDFWSEIDTASSDFDAVECSADSPAFVFYVDVNGKLTGVVHSHAALIGSLAAFEMFTNLEADSDWVFWASNQWRTVECVLGILYPAWWYGCSVVAAARGDDQLSVLERCCVTHAFFAAATMKDLTRERHGGRTDSSLELIVTDAPASAEAREWAETETGAHIAEFYCPAETGVIASSCRRWYSNREGSAGRLVPGRQIGIVDANGDALPAGRRGRVAIHASDPAVFLDYSNDDGRKGSAMRGDWFLTRDFGYRSDDNDLFVTTPPKASD